jgi:hypothetical protein
MSVFSGTASKGGGGDEYDIPPAGSFAAALVAIIDLGTHREEFQGKSKDVRKVFLVWELPGEKISGTGNNHVIGREFSLSFTPKSILRIFAEKWRGKSYNEGETIDIAKMLGKSCLLSIIHATSKSSGSEFAKADSVSQLPKGMTVGATQHKPFLWELDSAEDPPQHTWLPFIFGSPVHEKIHRSKEWIAAHAGKPQSANGQPQPAQQPQQPLTGTPQAEVPF